MRLFLSLLLFLMTGSSCFANSVWVLTVNGDITPAVQDYIQEAIQKADPKEVKSIVIRLNAASGLELSMRNVNESLILSPVPIIAWVAPEGAHAFGGGTYLLYASHLAAMAEGTQVGDAILPTLWMMKESGRSASLAYQKLLQDTTAYLKSLAQLRGRNADFAEIAVTKAARLSAQSAYRQKVIDEMANDVPTLLKRMDGHNAVVVGVMEKIQVKDASIVEKPPGLRFQILSWITQPALIYLLFLIAIYGIFSELAIPGLIFPGLIGSMALVILLYALQWVAVNFTGIGLLLLGSALLISEFYLTSYAILASLGFIIFFLGSWMLFDFSEPYYVIARPMIMGFSVLGLICILLILRLVIRSARSKIITGADALVGYVGVVSVQSDKRLTLWHQGSFWNILSDEVLQAGDVVEVKGVQGITLIVKRVSSEEKKHD